MSDTAAHTAYDSPVKTALAFLFILVCAIGISYWLAPGIVRDFQIRGALVPADGVHSVRAWCKPKQVILSSCDVEIEIDGHSDKVEFDYLMPPGLIGKQQINVLQSKTQPGILTTSLGQDYLISRAVILLVLVACLLTPLLSGIRIRLSERRTRQVPQPARPSSVPTRVRRTGVVQSAGFGRR